MSLAEPRGKLLVCSGRRDVGHGGSWRSGLPTGWKGWCPPPAGSRDPPPTHDEAQPLPRDVRSGHDTQDHALVEGRVSAKDPQQESEFEGQEEERDKDGQDCLEVDDDVDRASASSHSGRDDQVDRQLHCTDDGGRVLVSEQDTPVRDRGCGGLVRDEQLQERGEDLGDGLGAFESKELLEGRGRERLGVLGWVVEQEWEAATA